MNSLKTILLLGILSVLMIALGGAIGGKQGVMIAFIIALVTNIGSYWFSAPMALAMSGAQPLERSQAPELYEIIESLAQKANIPMPTIHLIPTQAANAFATGRNPEHSAIAVTAGIMQILNRDELEAVLAHELGHVRNRDILLTTVAAVLASTVTMIANVARWGVFFNSSDSREGDRNPLFILILAILAPMAATLVQLAVSRAREFEADATGAELSGKPLALASALAKVEEASQAIPLSQSNPALSSLYIITPNPQSWFVTLFSNHPSTPERIKRLEAMARGQF